MMKKENLLIEGKKSRSSNRLCLRKPTYRKCSTS